MPVAAVTPDDRILHYEVWTLDGTSKVDCQCGIHQPAWVPRATYQLLLPRGMTKTYRQRAYVCTSCAVYLIFGYDIDAAAYEQLSPDKRKESLDAG